VSVLLHINPLISNDHETNNNTTAIAREQILNKQQFNYNKKLTVRNGVFYAVCAKELYPVWRRVRIPPP
jgi:hypothetical protein